MAEPQTQTPQTGLNAKPVTPKGQGNAPSDEPQPVFRDWASI